LRDQPLSQSVNMMLPVSAASMISVRISGLKAMAVENRRLKADVCWGQHCSGLPHLADYRWAGQKRGADVQPDGAGQPLPCPKMPDGGLCLKSESEGKMATDVVSKRLVSCVQAAVDNFRMPKALLFRIS